MVNVEKKLGLSGSAWAFESVGVMTLSSRNVEDRELEEESLRSTLRNPPFRRWVLSPQPVESRLPVWGSTLLLYVLHFEQVPSICLIFCFKESYGCLLNIL